GLPERSQARGGVRQQPGGGYFQRGKRSPAGRTLSRCHRGDVTDDRAVEYTHPPRPYWEYGVAHAMAPLFERRAVLHAKRAHGGRRAHPGVALLATDRECGIAIERRLGAGGARLGGYSTGLLGTQKTATLLLHVGMCRRLQAGELERDTTTKGRRVLRLNA